MIVRIVESNLMWSSRLVKSVRACGAEPVLASNPDPEPCDVVILNLGDLGEKAMEVTSAFRQVGAVVVAHAGHKEKELHALGKEAGCDILATNSELTWKLEKILEKARNIRSGPSVKEL